MSEKFGLDWKKYDYERMRDFMEIMIQIPAVEASTNQSNKLPNKNG